MTDLPLGTPAGRTPRHAAGSLLLRALAAHLEVHRLRHSTESVLQCALAACLRHGAFVFHREQVAGAAGRPDFLVYGEGDAVVAVEVKVGGSFAELLEQAQRYALWDGCDGVLVVTTRECHDQLPEAIAGKPVRTVVVSALLS